MKTKLGLIVMMAVVISALIAMATGVALASGIQHWKLDNDNQMERVAGPGDDGQSGSVNISATSSVIWLADEAAQPSTGVTFPNGSWVTHLCLDSNWAASVSVRVGSWDGTTFTAFATTGSGPLTWDGGKQQLKSETQTGSETVAQNDYLALEITNNDSVAHKVMTNGCSELASPCSDPGYPTPEIATGLLVGIGALGLAGYVFVRRRQAQDILA